jgi:hypothetical protein
MHVIKHKNLYLYSKMMILRFLLINIFITEDKERVLSNVSNATGILNVFTLNSYACINHMGSDF